jgi:hypothetical protein
MPASAEPGAVPSRAFRIAPRAYPCHPSLSTRSNAFAESVMRHISQRPGRWTKIRHRHPRQRVPDIDCMPLLTASPPARACAGGGLVARIGAPWWGLLADSRIGACCRSSVVEHSIGNGEVDSSILSGSTIPPHKNPNLERADRVDNLSEWNSAGQASALPVARARHLRIKPSFRFD